MRGVIASMGITGAIQIRPRFDRVAHEYEAIHNRNLKLTGETSEFFVEHKVGILERFWREAKLPWNARFLDYGCGIGRTCHHLKRAVPGVEYIGIDPSPESIRIALARSAGAEFHVYDGMRLPFPDHAFDVIFAAAVVHHIQPQHRKSSFAEIARALKPGGYLFVFEHNPWNPVTQYIVKSCEFDDDAVLISAPALKRHLAAADLRALKSEYVLFFPKFLRKRFPQAEEKLSWLPLGAQYWVAARKPQA